MFKICFIDLKDTVTKRRGWDIILHLLVYTPNGCNNLRWVRLKPEASPGSLTWIQGPITRSIICHFPRCVFWELDQKLQLVPMWDADTIGSGLMSYVSPNTHYLWISFSINFWSSHRNSKYILPLEIFLWFFFLNVQVWLSFIYVNNCYLTQMWL